MEKELSLIILKEFMKVNGLMIKDTEWALNDLQMETFMKGNIKKEKCMGKVNIHG